VSSPDFQAAITRGADDLVLDRPLDGPDAILVLCRGARSEADQLNRPDSFS
jgi:hypothetical protein